MKEESVNHILDAVGTPSANGQAERYHRILTPMLAKICETSKKWDEALPLVEFGINNTVYRSTGETPRRLLFGVAQLGRIKDKVRIFLVNQNMEQRDLPAIRKTAANNLEINRKTMERSYNRGRAEAAAYKEGDYVVIVNVDTTIGANKKLIPKFKGPYMIHKVLDADRYAIRDIPPDFRWHKPHTIVLWPLIALNDGYLSNHYRISSLSA
ncbi:uncharacterized protein [Prorops nasuta]|uniref:uncharacterized protein n=1 Tax=Prorops nasuta TaxID=863751 RepID=UPI0034CEB26D